MPNDFRKLSRGDVVKVIDKFGTAWRGDVASCGGSFVQLTNGATYWTEDGGRVGGNGRIEQVGEGELEDLIDISFLE